MPRCDSEWFKKQKNKSKARVFDLALQGAHHISISVLASVDGGASDSSQPLYSGPVLPALGKEEGRLFTSYSSAPKPKPQTAPWLMPPSLSWPQSQIQGSLKSPTVTTSPPPVATTLLSQTYHPKH